jgi:hypothetical protein
MARQVMLLLPVLPLAHTRGLQADINNHHHPMGMDARALDSNHRRLRAISNISTLTMQYTSMEFSQSQTIFQLQLNVI